MTLQPGETRTSGPIYSPAIVEARLTEAARTLARMPDLAKLQAARTSFWRDVLPDGRAPSPLGRPGSADIDRMDEAWRWLGLVESIDARKILLARAVGCTWRRLEMLDGRCSVTLRKLHRAALAEVAAELNLRAPLQTAPILAPLRPTVEELRPTRSAPAAAGFVLGKKFDLP